MKIPYKYAIALTVAVGLFMSVLDSTIVNVGLSAMQKSFKTDVNTIQWVITAYFLSQAAVIPVAGYLANQFGIKRMFMLTLFLFTLGSFLCGLSPVIGGEEHGELVLIISRILQGVGGGAIFPLATSLAMAAFPPEERATSSAIVATPVMLAPAFGPVVGGLLIDTVGWPWMFYINLPIGLVLLFVVQRLVRPDNLAESRALRAQSGFDYPGLTLSMVGIVLVVYAFTLVGQTDGATISPTNPNGTTYGWGYWLVWVLLAAGLGLLAIFTFYETRIAKDPVLDLRLFAKREFLFSSLLSWVVNAVVFGSFFLLPLYLEQFKGLSALQTGLAIMPQGITTAAIISLGSILYNKIGPRNLILIGFTLLTVSSLMLANSSKETDAWSLLPILVLRGVGFGWSFFPLQTTALASVVGRALPKASSLYNATRQIFSSIGVAMLSTLFIQSTFAHRNQLVAEAQAAKQPVASDIALQSAIAGMNNVFLVVSIVLIVAMGLIFFLPAKSVKQLAALQNRESSQPAEKMAEKSVSA